MKIEFANGPFFYSNVANRAFAEHCVDTQTALYHFNNSPEAKAAKEAKEELERKEMEARCEAAFLENIRHPDYAYCRARHFGTMVYFRCPGSPSGVTAANGGIVSNAFAQKALAELNMPASLSPTEMQHKSGANLYR